MEMMKSGAVGAVEEDSGISLLGSSSNTVEEKPGKKQKKQKNNQDRKDKNAEKRPALSEEALVAKEEAKAIRESAHINVEGSDVPSPIREFEQLKTVFNFKRYLLRNIESCGYTFPTPIQMQVIPTMCKGRDVVAISPTGSGKTAAYLLPILHTLKEPEKEGIRAVILAPTRELAQQIYRHLKKLSLSKPFKICVLTKIVTSASHTSINLGKNYDILISTPMRLVNLIQENKFAFNKIQMLVFDEGDRLFDENFLTDVDSIVAACRNPSLRVSLFSATILPKVEELARTILRDPVRIHIGVKNAAAESVDQKLLFVGTEDGKLLALRQLVAEGLHPPVLIFVQSKERAQELFHELVYSGLNVDVIHGERTKQQRDVIVERFRAGQLWVLIATELMSRGMDFKGVSLVINYDFPQSTASYIHRIGRTGRAGRPGKAITLFTEDDAVLLRSIANIMKQSGCEVPEWIFQKYKKADTFKRRRLQKLPPEREPIRKISLYDLKMGRKLRQLRNRDKRIWREAGAEK